MGQVPRRDQAPQSDEDSYYGTQRAGKSLLKNLKGHQRKVATLRASLIARGD